MTEKKFISKNYIKTLREISKNFIHYVEKNSEISVRNDVDFYVEDRIKNNNKYLNELDFFLNKKENEIEILYLNLIKFIEKHKKDNFHKNKKFEEIFKSFNSLNLDFRNKFLFLGEDFIFKCLCVNILISLYETASKTITENLKDDDKPIYYLEENLSEDEIDHPGLNFYYTKEKFTSCIQNNFINVLIILSTAFNYEIKLFNMNIFIIKFVLFLESEKFLKIKHTRSVFNKKIKNLVKYSLNDKEDLDINVFFMYNYNSFSKKELFILKKINFLSETIKKNTYLIVPDFIFKFKPLIKENKHYSCIINDKKDEYGINSSNLSTHALKLFEESLKLDLGRKIFWDKNSFHNIISLFLENRLRNLEISLETSFEELISKFKNFALIKSNINKNIMRDILIIIFFKKFKDDFNDSIYFYFLFFFDFRSRKYYDSFISITNCVFTRFFIFYGYYSFEELLLIVEKSKEKKSFSILEKYLTFVEENKKNFHESFFCLNERENEDFLIFKKIILINTLISIGILKKSSMLLDGTSLDGFTLSMDNFFYKGYNELVIFNKNKKTPPINDESEDIEDKIKLLKNLNLISNELNIYKKEIVPYDFSCSGHQLRYLYTGFEDIINYQYINVSGTNVSTDLYSFVLENFKHFLKEIIQKEKKTDFINYLKKFVQKDDLIFNTYEVSENKFKEIYINYINEKKETIIDISTEIDKIKKLYHEVLVLLNFENFNEFDLILSLFKRKNFKKSIMTTQYSVRYPSFEKYFKKAIRFTQDELIFEKHSKRVLILIKILYHFANNLNEFSNFKCKKSIELVFSEIEANGFIVTLFDGFKVPLGFFLKSNLDKRVVYIDENKKRYTQKIDIYDNLVYLPKTKNCFNPNFVHSIDASNVRAYNLFKILNDVYCTIHDEFWVPWQESLIFKDEINFIVKIDFFKIISEKDIETCIKNKKIPVYLIQDNLLTMYNFFIIL